MKLAGGAETYFKTLEAEGVKGVRPFREIGKMGMALPGTAPMAMGGAAGALMNRKKIRKIVKQEIDNELKSHQGPGMNGMTFF